MEIGQYKQVRDDQTLPSSPLSDVSHLCSRVLDSVLYKTGGVNAKIRS